MNEIPEWKKEWDKKTLLERIEANLLKMFHGGGIRDETTIRLAMDFLKFKEKYFLKEEK